MRTTIINKNEKIGKVKDILDTHGIITGFGWEIIFAGLLNECEEYIEVHGFGDDALCKKINVAYLILG